MLKYTFKSPLATSWTEQLVKLQLPGLDPRGAVAAGG